MAGNPVVFFDIAINNKPEGRIKFELFADICPKTAENFRQFCTGETKGTGGVPLGYKGCEFHRIVPGFCLQGGDFINGNGTGSASIYGSNKFADENFIRKHDTAGLLSMANSGPDTNGCQFFITLAPARFLDGKHVVFGRVIEGMSIVRAMEKVPTGADDRPRQKCIITECGEM